MLARALLAAVLLIFAVTLDAYAPPRLTDGEGREKAADSRERNAEKQERDRGDRLANAANARVITAATLYHAPNQAIGMLRVGARVRVDRYNRAWAHVTFVNNQIAVQGWVRTSTLAPLTEGQGDRATGGDRVKTQEERERKRNADRERKQQEHREEAKDR